MTHELQSMQDAVPRHVAASPRAARIASAIQGLQKDLSEFRQLRVAMHNDLQAANARPDVSRSELDRLVEAYDTRRKVLRARVLARHTEMIAATTADEWRSLARHEHKALTAAEECAPWSIDPHAAPSAGRP